jgi:hypothetical protein
MDVQLQAVELACSVGIRDNGLSGTRYSGCLDGHKGVSWDEGNIGSLYPSTVLQVCLPRPLHWAVFVKTVDP